MQRTVRTSVLYRKSNPSRRAVRLASLFRRNGRVPREIVTMYGILLQCWRNIAPLHSVPHRVIINFNPLQPLGLAHVIRSATPMASWESSVMGVGGNDEQWAVGISWLAMPCHAAPMSQMFLRIVVGLAVSTDLWAESRVSSSNAGLRLQPSHLHISPPPRKRGNVAWRSNGRMERCWIIKMGEIGI